MDPRLVLDLPLHQLDGDAFKSRDAYGHLCSVTGALWTPYGRVFNGSSNFIDLAGFSSTAQSYTFEFWARSSQAATISKNLFDAEAGRLNVAWFTDTSGKIGFFDGTWHSLADAPNDGDWHRLAFLLDAEGGASKYYQDALLKGTGGYTGVNIGGAVKLGCNYPGASSWFLGDLGEVLIHEGLRTLLELQRGFLATKWRYR